MTHHSLPTWYARILQQVKHEAKKAVALGLLVLVMTVMWGRIFLFGPSQTGPAAANAAKLLAPETVEAARTSISPSAKALLEFTQKPVSPVRRNLFAVKLDLFPQDASHPVVASDNDSDGFWDQLAKSLAAKADQEKARAIRVENLKSMAAKLDLQSTVMIQGAPKALINGVLVGEGAVVDGFRIAKIEAKRILVEREDVKLEVTFKFQ